MSLHTSRTVTALKAMDKTEFKEFSDFIHSPFSKSSPMVRKSFEYLKSCAPAFEKTACNKVQFSETVLGKSLDGAGNKEINRLLSELAAGIEKFVVLQYADANSPVKFQALMFWYYRRNLKAPLKGVFKEVEQLVKNNRIDGVRQVYIDYMQHKINEYVAKGDRIQLYLLFSHFTTLVQEHYGIELSQSEIGLTNLKDFMGKELIRRAGKTRPGFLPISFSRELQFQEKLQAFTNRPDLAAYRYLLKCADDNTLRISVTDKDRLLTILSNNLRKLFSGTEASEQLVAIYKRKIQHANLLYKGNIAYSIYRDLLFHLCNLNRISEAEALQKSTGNKVLGVPDVNNFLDAYRAFILFEKKQYTEALKLATAAKVVDHLMGIHLRVLQIKIAYEIDDQNLLNAYINALRKFVTIKIKKQLDHHYSAQLLLFATYLLQLSKLKPGKKIELLKLQTEMNGAKLLTAKPWLLAKAAEKLKGKI